MFGPLDQFFAGTPTAHVTTPLREDADALIVLPWRNNKGVMLQELVKDKRVQGHLNTVDNCKAPAVAGAIAGKIERAIALETMNDRCHRRCCFPGSRTRML